ncbi:Adenosylhomocysteinase [Platanthera guangdongensis]|uniref:Adenosylhomocysteinase n=1 Tax=Platanthera guangdongensis TaxID=2320717 RepID=A0ABR2M5Q1_9ASPA
MPMNTLAGGATWRNRSGHRALITRTLIIPTKNNLDRWIPSQLSLKAHDSWLLPPRLSSPVPDPNPDLGPDPVRSPEIYIRVPLLFHTMALLVEKTTSGREYKVKDLSQADFGRSRNRARGG